MKTRGVVGSLLLLTAIATIGFFIVREDMVQILLGVDLGSLAIILLASCLALAIRGQQLANVTEPFGVRFRLGESTGLSALHTLSNYLPGRAGLVIRGAYLHRFHSVSVADYTAMTALWLVGSLLSAVFLGATLAASGVGDVNRGMAFAVFTGCGLALLVGYLGLEWAVGRGVGEGRFTRWLQRVRWGLRLWRERGSWRLWFVVWSFGLLLTQGLRYWVALRALGDTSGLVAALVIQSLVALSVLVSVTPGNLGVREGVAAFGALLTGVNPQIALLAAVIDRAAALAISLVGFALLGNPLLRQFRQNTAAPS